MLNSRLKSTLAVLAALTTSPLLAGVPDLTASSWIAPCTTSPDNTITRDRLEFTADAVVATSDVYTDQACAALQQSLSVASSYKLGTDTKLAGAFSIDLSIGKLTMTVVSDALAKQYNDINFCSYSDWQKGQGKDVTGNDCVGAAALKPGTLQFDLLELQIATDQRQTLRFGDTSGANDGSTAMRRPIALDGSETYVRIK